MLCHSLAELSRSHMFRNTPGRTPWTSDQLVVKVATYTTHNEHTRRTSIPLAKLEPAILAP